MFLPSSYFATSCFALDAPLMQHVTLQDLFATRLFATGSNTTMYGQRTAAVFEGCVPVRPPSRVNTVKCESALGCSSTFFLLPGAWQEKGNEGRTRGRGRVQGRRKRYEEEECKEDRVKSKRKEDDDRWRSG